MPHLSRITLQAADLFDPAASQHAAAGQLLSAALGWGRAPLRELEIMNEAFDLAHSLPALGSALGGSLRRLRLSQCGLPAAAAAAGRVLRCLPMYEALEVLELRINEWEGDGDNGQVRGGRGNHLGLANQLISAASVCVSAAGGRRAATRRWCLMRPRTNSPETPAAPARRRAGRCTR